MTQPPNPADLRNRSPGEHITDEQVRDETLEARQFGDDTPPPGPAGSASGEHQQRGGGQDENARGGVMGGGLVYGAGRAGTSRRPDDFSDDPISTNYGGLQESDAGSSPAGSADQPAGPSTPQGGYQGEYQRGHPGGEEAGFGGAPPEVHARADYHLFREEQTRARGGEPPEATDAAHATGATDTYGKSEKK